MRLVPSILLLALASSLGTQAKMLQMAAPRTGGSLQAAPVPPVGPAPPTAVEPPKQVGGNVTAPVLLKKVEAKFTDAGRKAKVNGTVLVGMIVATDGIPSNVHVIKSLGYGLDETAVEAIKQYRFKPSMQDGKPVRVEVNVEVHFQIFSGRFHL